MDVLTQNKSLTHQSLTPNQRSTAYQYLATNLRYPTAENTPLAQDYMQTFEPSVYKEACSLYESSYTSATQDTVFEELMRFYHHFGLERASDADLPDHLAVELEFMHYLTHLEHKTLERGDDNSHVRRAQKDFLSRHLQRLVNGICEKSQNQSAHYRELLDTLTDFIQLEIDALQTA